jgi:cellulose synthase/poly-beta-1,6-N-acetylglucosamine synthase-like glycosyltransferase
MLRILALVAQTLVIALIAYNLITALWGWRNPRSAPEGGRIRRFRVVIPARDEGRVIGSLLGDLSAQTYSGPFQVWVLADRCSDDTVAVAESWQVHVDERQDGPDGKGALLTWHLDRHPLAHDESLVVFDADNRVPGETLDRLADEVDAGHGVVQLYLDVSNPTETLLTTASALTYWAGNRMVQLARSNLGWSAELGGTGMCLTAAAIANIGGVGDGLTEDQDMTTRAVLAGERVHWVHDLRIKDEKPATWSPALAQRARWMAGKRSVANRSVPALVRAGISRRSFSEFDQVIRLVQPGRSFVALVSMILIAVAFITGSSWLLPWQLWLSVVLLQLTAPILYLVRDGVPARRILRYPLVLLIALLWFPAWIASRSVRSWKKTTHRGA